jgi:hypothetical protein
MSVDTTLALKARYLSSFSAQSMSPPGLSCPNRDCLSMICTPLRPAIRRTDAQIRDDTDPKSLRLYSMTAAATRDVAGGAQSTECPARSGMVRLVSGSSVEELR